MGPKKFIGQAGGARPAMGNKGNGQDLSYLKEMFIGWQSLADYSAFLRDNIFYDGH